MANFVDENELQEGSEEEISQVTEQTQEPQVQETPAPEPEEPQGLGALFDLPDPKPSRKRGPYKKRVKP